MLSKLMSNQSIRKVAYPKFHKLRKGYTVIQKNFL